MSDPYAGLDALLGGDSKPADPFAGLDALSGTGAPDLSPPDPMAESPFWQKIRSEGLVPDWGITAGKVAEFLAPAPNALLEGRPQDLAPKWDEKKSALDNLATLGTQALGAFPGTAQGTKLGDLVTAQKGGKTYAQEMTPAAKVERAPGSLITKALDKTVMLPFYGLSRFVDESLTNGLNVFKAAGAAYDEVKNIITGDPAAARTSFSDVVKHVAPEFAKSNPILTEQMGLMGDLVIDPLNWIGAKEALIPLEKGLAVIDKPITRQLLSVAKGKAFEMLSGEAAKAAKATEVADTVGKSAAAYTEWLAKEGRTGPEALTEFKGILERSGQGDKQVESLAKELEGLQVGPGTAGAAPPGIGTPDRLAEYFRNAPVAENRVRENLAKVGAEAAGVPEKNVRQGLDTVATFADSAKTPLEKDMLVKAAADSTGTPESLLRDMNQGEFKVPPPIPEETITATAHKMIADLVKAPEFEFGGKVWNTADMVGKPGFAVFGKTVVPSGSLGRAAEKALGTLMYHRINGIIDKINIFKPIDPKLQDLARELTVETSKGIEEVSTLRNKIYGDLAREAVAGKGGGLNPLRRATNRVTAALENFGKMAYEADSLANKQGRELFTHELDGLFEKFNITKGGRAAYVALMDQTKRLKELDLAAGLYKEEAARFNYQHMYYTWIRKPRNVEEAIAAEKVKNMAYPDRAKAMSEFFAPGIERDATLQAARHAGFEPVWDAAQITTRRYLMSKIVMARKNFNEGLKRIYGTDVIDEIAKIDKKAASAIRFIGDSNMSMFVPDEMARNLLNLWDRHMNTFRHLGTIAGPAFAPKNIVQNSLQIVMGLGAKGFGVFDPRNIYDSIMAIGHLRGMIDETNPILDRVIVGSPALGKTSLRKLFSEAKQFDVLKSTDLSTTARAIKSSTQDLIDYTRFGDPGEHGLKRMMDGVVHYTNWPSNVEDTMRFATFMNARKLGYDAKTAAAMTNRVLFDYGAGLNAIERQIIRRFLVPYYSFPRFATELFGKTLVTNPARVANLYKAARHFTETWEMLHTKDTLTEDEQRAVQGANWIVEQPHAFKGFDPRMQAQFNVFNNFSPLDIMGNTVESPDGSVDMAATFRHAFLAQLAPYFKVPLEMSMNKQFFTDQAISEPGKPGKKMGQIPPEIVLSRVAAALTASGTGNIALAAATAMGFQGAGQTDEVKATARFLLGAQEALDPKTGQKLTYVNPYRWYLATTLYPKLNVIVRSGREDYNPMARTLELMAGIGTLNADLKKQYGYQLKAKRDTMQGLLSQYHSLMRIGATSDAQDKYDEFLRMQQLLQEQLQSTDYSNIRGGE